MIGLFLWIFTFLDVSASELVVVVGAMFFLFYFLFELVCVRLSLTYPPSSFFFFFLRSSYRRSIDVRNLPIAEEDEKDKDHSHVVPQINSESESTQRGMHSADIIFFFYPPSFHSNFISKMYSYSIFSFAMPLVLLPTTNYFVWTSA